jgi:hypothetical protein
VTGRWFRLMQHQPVPSSPSMSQKLSRWQSRDAELAVRSRGWLMRQARWPSAGGGWPGVLLCRDCDKLLSRTSRLFAFWLGLPGVWRSPKPPGIAEILSGSEPL